MLLSSLWRRLKVEYHHRGTESVCKLHVVMFAFAGVSAVPVQPQPSVALDICDGSLLGRPAWKPCKRVFDNFMGFGSSAAITWSRIFRFHALLQKLASGLPHPLRGASTLSCRSWHQGSLTHLGVWPDQEEKEF